MSDEQNKPQPVDNSHLDAGIAARAEKADAPKPVETDATQPKAEGQTDEQNQTEGTAASEADDATAQRPKNKGVGKRIDELTREKYDAQRERDYWREQAMRNQRQPEQPQQVTQNDQASDEPTMEQHGFDIAAYNRAWYDWRKQQDAKAEQQAKSQQEQQDRGRKYQESVQAFAQAHPDFHDVFHGDLPVTVAMAEAITESDNPAAVAYFLGQNPDEAARIAGLTPGQVTRAIGRIEAQIEAQAKAATQTEPAATQQRQPEPKTVTKAPAPVTTLTGAPAVVKDLDDMSMAEYDAERRKQRKARGL